MMYCRGLEQALSLILLVSIQKSLIKLRNYHADIVDVEMI